MARPSSSTLALVLAGLGATACSSDEPSSCLDQAPPSWLADGWITETGALADDVTPNIRILTINVGNGVVEAGPYSLRLAHQGYEDLIAARIQALAPDIIGIQEVTPAKQAAAAAACPVHPDADGFCTAGAGYVCEQLTCTDVESRPDQVERLVGPDYTVLCAGLDGEGVDSVDCLAIHADFGRVVDYHDGQLLVPGAYRPKWGEDAPNEWTFWRPPGFEGCNYIEGECSEKAEHCDFESSILWADVAVGPDHDQHIRMVHLHPTAIGDRCREHQLARAFEAATADPDARILMLGDWNHDPDRLVVPVEEALYYAYVGPTRPLHEHDERDEDCARVRTGPHIAGQRPAALDRVVTDFAIGFCQVFDDRESSMHGISLAKFDEGLGPSALPDTQACNCCYAADIEETAIDHAAVLCDLVWPDAPY